MAKRKRNQQAASAKSENDAASPSKKVKVAGDTPQNPTPQEKNASGELPAATQDAKRQTEPTPSNPADSKLTGEPGLSKSARKRERKRKMLREAKKSTTSTSTGKAELLGQANPSEQKPAPQQQINAPVSDLSQPPAAQTNKTIAKGKNREGQKPTNNNSSKKPSEIKKGSESSKAPTLKKKQEIPTKKATDQQSGNPAAKKSEGANGGSDEKVSKKKLRRQKEYQAKQAATMSGGHQKKTLPNDAQSKSSKQVKSLPSTSQAPTNKTSSSGTSLLHEATKTSLLSRPVKQWVEQDEMGHSDSTGVNDDSRQQAASNDIFGPLTGALQGTQEEASSRLTPTSATPKKPSSLPKSSSTGPQNEIPDSFTTVSVPSNNQEPAAVSTPLTRPGVKTIASFSLSSRRHPASVLAKQRTINGLSGMRMETGMIGSSPKPVSAIKATSVPSYSGSGDVKAAFSRFNKFARGGNSSESDEDSDDSDSSSDDEADEKATPGAVRSVTRDAKMVSTAQSDSPSQRKAVASVANDLVGTDAKFEDAIQDDTTKLDAPSSHSSQINNIVHTNDPAVTRVSDSADSSGSEDEAMVDSAAGHVDETTNAPVETDNSAAAPIAGDESLAYPPNNAPRMLGEEDLPLFSEFNAKHNILSADARLERSASFLARELGGAHSGFGHTDDIDYVASQDADELYKSIEDISREVFGSTREIPDCKPLSNHLDVATEPSVTGFISDHGLGRKSAELETPDKTTALDHSLRGSSPVVYIVNEMDVDGSTGLDNAGKGIDEQEAEDEEEQDIDNTPLNATQEADPARHSSPLTSISTLTPSQSPTSPEDRPRSTSADAANNQTNDGDGNPESESGKNSPKPVTEAKKRKLTGTTSKHFSPKKPLIRTGKAVVKDEPNDIKNPTLHEAGDDLEQPPTSSDVVEISKSQKPSKKKGTGKTSAFFTPTVSPSKPTDTKKTTPRPPKGTSTCPVPSTNSAHFGLIQEKLWDQPFWLIIAVTFLNKTAGRAAAPIFWSLKELYPTPEALSQAKEKDLVDMIGTLGLQNQRARRLILISKTWLENPPAKTQRYRTLHYPAKGDGKDIKKDQVIEEDADECEGALEIGHIPGCGPYAWDSWRIFCRDVQRGLAKDFNGRGSGQVGFVPEWQRVVPLDKELRACLRWMWLREGYVWNHETGSKRDATLQEMEAALKGEMEIADEQERKFAMEAASGAGAGIGDVGTTLKNESGDDNEGAVKAAPSKKAKKTPSRKVSIARRELDVGSDEEVAVSTVRRSRRNKPA